MKNQHSYWLKILPIVIVTCLLSVVTAAFARSAFSIAYIGFSTDKPFWVALSQSIKSAADEKRISLIDLTPTEPDTSAQVRLLEHAINKNVDAIIVGANSPGPLYGSLSKAQRANIPVIAVDTMLDHPAIHAFVATDNHEGARLAGKYIVEKTKGMGTVLILGGSKNHPNGDIRRDGVSMLAKESGMPVIFRHADWDDEKAYKITLETLRKEKNVSAIFACWDPGIDTASHALKRINYTKQPVMVGFDGLPRTVKYIKEGKVTATVAQDTAEMGRKSIELAVKVIKSQKVPQTTLIPPFIIDADSFAKD